MKLKTPAKLNGSAQNGQAHKNGKAPKPGKIPARFTLAALRKKHLEDPLVRIRGNKVTIYDELVDLLAGIAASMGCTEQEAFSKLMREGITRDLRAIKNPKNPKKHAEILASLEAEANRVRIPRFYDWFRAIGGSPDSRRRH